jgi:acetylxylan esterase
MRYLRDTTLYPQNFQEEIKQWTNVFGVSQTPTATATNSPLSGYTRTSYGPNVQGILAQGVGHTVPEQENDVMTWFGLTSLTPGGGGGGGSGTPTSTAPSSTGSPTGGAVAHWGQCSGIGYTGPTSERVFIILFFVLKIKLPSLRRALHMRSVERIRMSTSIF